MGRIVLNRYSWPITCTPSTPNSRQREAHADGEVGEVVRGRGPPCRPSGQGFEAFAAIDLGLGRGRLRLGRDGVAGDAGLVLDGGRGQDGHEHDEGPGDEQRDDGGADAAELDPLGADEVGHDAPPGAAHRIRWRRRWRGMPLGCRCRGTPGRRPSPARNTSSSEDERGLSSWSVTPSSAASSPMVTRRRCRPHRPRRARPP